MAQQAANQQRPQTTPNPWIRVPTAEEKSAADFAKSITTSQILDEWTKLLIQKRPAEVDSRLVEIANKRGLAYTPELGGRLIQEIAIDEYNILYGEQLQKLPLGLAREVLGRQWQNLQQYGWAALDYRNRHAQAVIQIPYPLQKELPAEPKTGNTGPAYWHYRGWSIGINVGYGWGYAPWFGPGWGLGGYPVFGRGWRPYGWW